MTRKKVLITTGIYPPDIGGPATYSKLLVDELPKHGIDVDVLNFSPLKKYPQGIRHVIFLFQILRVGSKVDVIFAQDPVSVGLPSAFASMVLRKPLVLKIVGDYAWEQGMQRFGVEELLDDFQTNTYGLRVEILRSLEHWVAHRARIIIVPSKYLKGIVSQWDIPPERITVIYNAVEVQSIEKSKHQARQELSIEGIVLISIGRLVPWKGFSTLIEVTGMLKERYPNIQLIIIGEGGQRQALEQKIHALNLENHVFLKGALSKDETFLHLEAADVFILNTGYEGFSHTILEAMVAGTPVLTTQVGGNTELIDDHVNGLLVEFNNRKQIYQAIIMLLEDTELTTFIIRKAQSTVDTFSRQRMIEKTMTELYQDLI
jgi:glycosyltransferase involved in cell wall biosynthesis